MDTEKLVDKAKFVFEEADKQAEQYFTKELREAFKALEERSEKPCDYTLISSDINAYLG